jgi:hypothetical protein
LLGTTFRAENVNTVRSFATDTELRSLYVGVIYYCDGRFVKMVKKNRFNIIWQLSSLFSKKEKILYFVAFFSSHVRLFLFEYLSNRMVGTCQTCYRHYCPTLSAMFHLSVIPRTHSTESSSNEHYNTERHQLRCVVTWKRWRISRKVIYIFCSKWSTQQSP